MLSALLAVVPAVDRVEPDVLAVLGEEVRIGAFAGARAMVVRLDVRLDVKARTGAVVACGGHKMVGGSLGIVRLRGEGVTAMRPNLRRTKVRRQEHSFDEHLYLWSGVGDAWSLFGGFAKKFWESF